MAIIDIDGYRPAHLSYSTVSGYRMCGAKFYFTKVLRLEEKPGLAAIAGNAVHTASERVDEYILEHGFEGLGVEPSAPLDTDNATTSTEE
jgi:hypothetical protein